MNTETLEVVLQDLKDDDAQLFCGYTPGVLKNDEAFKTLLSEFRIEAPNPLRALKALTAHVREALVQ